MLRGELMNKTGKTISMLAFGESHKSRKETFDAFMKLSKLNRELLEVCPGVHDFSVELKGSIRSRDKYECSICGGEVDRQEKIWYEKGVEHGRLSNSE